VEVSGQQIGVRSFVCVRHGGKSVPLGARACGRLGDPATISYNV
jgi:hypothetical protein